MLIILEGIDGCGKSTLAQALADYFNSHGKSSKIVKAPSDYMRKHVEKIKSPISRTLLFLGDIAELIDQEIVPALNSGYIVICDRLWPSTLVYQMTELFRYPNVVKSAQESLAFSIFGAFSYADNGNGYKLFMTESPHIFILDTPLEIALEHTKNRAPLDDFERKSSKEWEIRRQRYLDLDTEKELLGIVPVYLKTEDKTANELLPEIIKYLEG